MATGVQTLVLVLIGRKQLLSSRAEVKPFLGEAESLTMGLGHFSFPGIVLNLESQVLSQRARFPSFLHPSFINSFCTHLHPIHSGTSPVLEMWIATQCEMSCASAGLLISGMLFLWLVSDSEVEGLVRGAEGYSTQVCS